MDSASLPRPKRYQRKRTPTLLQMEAVECGAAALGIILGYFGKIVPLAELRQACGVSRDGSKASKVLKAARTYHLEAKGYKMDLEKLYEEALPFIIFWNFNHFLVVEGFGSNRVFLNDPATGPRTVSYEEFDEGYTGVVLVMKPEVTFRKGGSKTRLLPSLIRRLKGSYYAVILTLIIGLLLVFPGLAAPVLTQVFIDQVLIQDQTNWLRPLLISIVLVAFIQAFLSYLRQRYLRQLHIKLSMAMSSHFLWHLMYLPISYYAQRYPGEISSRILLNDRVSDVISGKLASTVIDALMISFYALLMAFYSWKLTGIGVSLALINVFILQALARQRVDASLRLATEEGKVEGSAIAGLQSIETLKATAQESDFFTRWAGYYTRSVNTSQKLARSDQVLSIVPTFITALTQLVILVIGGFEVFRGVMTIGMLIAFQSLMTSFQNPISRLLSFSSLLQELEGDLARLDDVLANPIDPILRSQRSLLNKDPQNSHTQEETSARLKGHLELRGITFGYSRLEEPLIKDFSFKIRPGQRVALVGGSGSGKSTVARLIAGLHEVWSGEILLDGVPRSQIPKEHLANSIAMVEQEIFLFEGTVRENLTLWDETISRSQIVEACKDAVIHDVITQLPDGYESILIEGGSNLSGGQKQRLEIARSLVNDPTLLIMDEATSALDTESEQIVMQNLRRRGCSCVIVAHRLSTVRDCDGIIVLEHGRVVEQGTHDYLWSINGTYRSLLESEGIMA